MYAAVFGVWKTQVVCVKLYETRVRMWSVLYGFESSCSCLELLFKPTQSQHCALCVCVCVCVCVRSPVARGCVKYNCCVRKWKVSICQSGGNDEPVRPLHWGTSRHSHSWTNDLEFMMWRCQVMMFEYGRYWGRLINKCIIMSQRGQL